MNKNRIALALLAFFIATVIVGCGPGENVVSPQRKDTLSAADRKDKQGK